MLGGRNPGHLPTQLLTAAWKVEFWLGELCMGPSLSGGWHPEPVGPDSISQAPWGCWAETAPPAQHHMVSAEAGAQAWLTQGMLHGARQVGLFPPSISHSTSRGWSWSQSMAHPAFALRGWSLATSPCTVPQEPQGRGVDVCVCVCVCTPEAMIARWDSMEAHGQRLDLAGRSPCVAPSPPALPAHAAQPQGTSPPPGPSI